MNENLTCVKRGNWLLSVDKADTRHVHDRWVNKRGEKGEIGNRILL